MFVFKISLNDSAIHYFDGIPVISEIFEFFGYYLGYYGYEKKRTSTLYEILPLFSVKWLIVVVRVDSLYH